MIEKIKPTLNIILGLIVIILTGYAIFVILQGGLQFYGSLKEGTQVALAIGLLSLIGTLFSLYYTKIKDRQLQIEASHVIKKQEIYKLFVEKIIESIAHPEKISEEGFSLEVRKKFMSNSLLWSNPKALKAYHKFRLSAQSENSNGYTDLASLLLAFRNDLGLSNKEIDEQTILEIIYDEDDIKELGIIFDK